LPVIAHLDSLDEDSLMRILSEPRNALIRQYQKLFAMEDVQMEITDDALRYIAAKAMEFKLGARGLRSLCEAILTDAMYEQPGSKDKNRKLVIDRTYCEEQLDRSKMAQLRAA
jgi:ATP-dependent Clp protease ATP-binding subunit ClpX